MKRVIKKMAWGQHQLTLETGEIARQASGAVMVNLDDTVVLVTVVGAPSGWFSEFSARSVNVAVPTLAASMLIVPLFTVDAPPATRATLGSLLVTLMVRPNSGLPPASSTV